MHRSLCKRVSISLGWIPRRQIAGEYVTCIFNFIGNCQTVFQRVYAILYFQQQWMKVLGAPNPCQHLILLILLSNFNHSNWCVVVLCCGFNCISLMMLSISSCTYLPSIYLPCWRISSNLLFTLGYLLIICCKNLYILDIYQMCVLQIVSPVYDLTFILLVMSFEEKHFILSVVY